MGEEPERDAGRLEESLREIFGDPADPYATIPDTVVYDVFADTETELSGVYIYFCDHAETEEERERWWAKVKELRDLRRSVLAEDRDAQLAYIERWRAEITELRNR